MQSYQNLKILQTLYKLKSFGYDYHSNINLNHSSSNIELSNDIEILNKQINNCFLCDLSKSRSVAMPGFGNKNADIMLIDYTVSEIDDTNKSYLNGKNGTMIKNMIQNVLEIPIEKIYYTHILKCKPSKYTDLANEEKTCKNYLLKQIDIIDPKIIIALGEDVYRSLTNDNTLFENIRGVMIEFENKKLFPIYHPNFILRNPNKKRILFNDLKMIKSLI